jgi:hypothetical protein
VESKNLLRLAQHLEEDPDVVEMILHKAYVRVELALEGTFNELQLTEK